VTADGDRLGLAAVFMAVNRSIEKTMFVLTPLGVLEGWILADSLAPLRPAVPWLFAFMTLSGALNLRVREIRDSLLQPGPILLFFFFSHLFMPVTALLVARLFNGVDPDLAAGFVLLFAIPTAITGFIWVSIYRGDGALCLALILLDSLAAPFLVPATITLLLGTSIAIDTSGMMISLVVMIVVPTLLGILLNEASRGRIPRLVSPYLAPTAKILLMLVVAINSAAIMPQVDFGNPRIWTIAGQSVLLGLMGFAAGRLAGLLGKLSPEKTKTLLFSVGLRNIIAAATLAIAFFPPAAALPAILGMIFQQSLASGAGKILIRSTQVGRT